jgi:glycosyltransferase involved in cell wall biosynthesis
VIATENRGLSAAVNYALRLSQGDYIQELDADDLLVRDKIERQLAALREVDGRRVLLSSPWAPFYYRTRSARFVHNSLCQGLAPVDWLLRKLSDNVHMQNATWLVSRELAEAAGPWDERLHYDQDGEYFARVVLASQSTRFVPGTGVFYRVSNASTRISHIGNSDRKKESLLMSMKLHIQYLRSLEDSERTRKACLAYLQNWYFAFYPDRPDALAELQALASQLQGRLERPSMSWKYAWIKPVFGLKAAKWAQTSLPNLKESGFRQFDNVLDKLEGRKGTANPGIDALRGSAR